MLRKQWLIVLGCWCLLVSGQPGWGFTLEQAIMEAVRFSPELSQARLAYQSALIGEPLLLSELDPHLGASAAYGVDRSLRAAPAFEGTETKRQDFSLFLLQKTLLGTEARLSVDHQKIISDSLFYAIQPAVESGFTVSLQQPLWRYLWGRPDRARRKTLRSETERARWQVLALEQEVALAAARSCLELEFALDRQRISKETLQTSRRLVESHREKRRYGMLEESEVLQAEAELALEETESLLAENTIESARARLKSVIGRDLSPEEVLVAGSTENIRAPARLEASIAEAVQNRPERRALESAIRGAESALHTLRLETLPELNLTAQLESKGLGRTWGQSWEGVQGLDHPNRTLGLQLVTPLAFKKEGLLRRQKEIELNNWKEELRRLDIQIERDIRETSDQLRLAMKRAALSQSLVLLERSKLQAERANFQRGRSSTDLLVRFQRDIHRAELDLARVRTELIGAELAYRKSLGRPLVPPRPERGAP